MGGRAAVRRGGAVEAEGDGRGGGSVGGGRSCSLSA
jgi:hypothetical protein